MPKLFFLQPRLPDGANRALQKKIDSEADERGDGENEAKKNARIPGRRGTKYGPNDENCPHGKDPARYGSTRAQIQRVACLQARFWVFWPHARDRLVSGSHAAR